jgi:metal-responsive CopG/Arc/MetJ family transcriptional regulator
MKIKTSISLESNVAKALDRMVGKGGKRSAAIELAVKEFLERRLRRSRDAREVELINRHAARLNREAEDVLTYQAEP